MIRIERSEVEELRDVVATLRAYIAAPEGDGPMRYREALALANQYATAISDMPVFTVYEDAGLPQSFIVTAYDGKTSRTTRHPTRQAAMEHAAGLAGVKL
jgi:hypothetical protein